MIFPGPQFGATDTPDVGGDRGEIGHRLRRVHLPPDGIGDRPRHRQPRPGFGEIDGLPCDLEHRRSGRVSCGGGDETLGDRHHIGPIREGLIELHHRELGVVPRRDPLVAEDATDLVDALHAAHDQALEVELEGDAQVELHIEVL